MSELILTDANFEEEVLKSELPVLVDFWAEWCIPCRMLTPLVEEIEQEYSGRLKVGKCNVDESPQSGTEYNIHSIPTLMVFYKGRIYSKKIGVMPKEQIIDMFKDIV